MLEKVREDYRESEVAERLSARDKQVMPEERYDSVEDYDACCGRIAGWIRRRVNKSGFQASEQLFF